MDKEEDEKYEEFIDGIKGLAEQMNQLTKLAHVQYSPVVEDLIKRRCTDENEIEHLLDWILDFAYEEKMLLLFKKVCRYYYPINPKATEDYINFYREMWDEDSLPNKNEELPE